MIKVKRYLLEILSINLKELKINLPKKFSIKLLEKKNFEINKFFYRQVGIDHYWRDRLIWSDKEWANYANKKNLETWTMKYQDDFVGFYEIEFHPNLNEIELINMGILKEYRGKQLGSKLLSHSINVAAKKTPKRMWVHTCSLDHKHALSNYKSKGFKIFQEEEIDFVA
jgi:ribosomal protein S18 acetylase RimI-like enzyme|tara:strand:- start:1914 stop:2420 length:507 start_codon:yes stop_codon:yes gene_type:complete